ncbi:MAG: ParB N-terminal domain-containing protein [Pirellulales bacterium]|nr:ParB N-terminal domain-containing protein [Pirellulales bacterium]
MHIRDRIKEFRRVRASSLRPHPRNWRTHPPVQRDALRGVLAEIGYAGALIVRELPDGSLELIDGHLRAETTPEQEVPVLVLDLDEREAAKLLAVLDPLADMAQPDGQALADLLAQVETENDAVRAMLDNLLANADPPAALEETDSDPPEVAIPEAFQVVVECRDEQAQQELYERLAADGYKCKLITL